MKSSDHGLDRWMASSLGIWIDGETGCLMKASLDEWTAGLKGVIDNGLD